MPRLDAPCWCNSEQPRTGEYTRGSLAKQGNRGNSAAKPSWPAGGTALFTDRFPNGCGTTAMPALPPLWIQYALLSKTQDYDSTLSPGISYSRNIINCPLCPASFKLLENSLRPSTLRNRKISSILVKGNIFLEPRPVRIYVRFLRNIFTAPSTMKRVRDFGQRVDSISWTVNSIVWSAFRNV